jgi:hypothetical protein
LGNGGLIYVCDIILTRHDGSLHEYNMKTFSYNKKDLAWGIESNAICVTAIVSLLGFPETERLGKGKVT